MEQYINTVDEVSAGTQQLERIVKTLELQRKLREDYVVPSGTLQYNHVTGLLEVRDNIVMPYQLTDLAHEQVAKKLDIPMSYYKKMLENYGELLGENINGWLSKKEKTKYLLRTFNYGIEGTNNLCRAMLSDRYNIIDNFDVLVAALEAIKKTGVDVVIHKAEITERRMYLHVIAPDIHQRATELLDGYLENRNTAVLNDGIISGMVISNSETGAGTFEISGRCQILRCKNGLHDRNHAFRKVHLGAKLDSGMIEWSQDTKNKNLEVIMSQIRDSVKLYLSEEYLGNTIQRLQKYKEIQIEHPESVVEKVSKELLIPEDHRVNILRHFLRDGDSSVLGVMNAVTRETQNMGADMQHDCESGIFDMLPRIKNFDKKYSKN